MDVYLCIANAGRPPAMTVSADMTTGCLSSSIDPAQVSVLFWKPSTSCHCEKTGPKGERDMPRQRRTALENRLEIQIFWTRSPHHHCSRYIYIRIRRDVFDVSVFPDVAIMEWFLPSHGYSMSGLQGEFYAKRQIQKR